MEFWTAFTPRRLRLLAIAFAREELGGMNEVYLSRAEVEAEFGRGYTCFDTMGDIYLPVRSYGGTYGMLGNLSLPAAEAAKQNYYRLEGKNSLEKIGKNKIGCYVHESKAEDILNDFRKPWLDLGDEVWVDRNGKMVAWGWSNGMGVGRVCRIDEDECHVNVAKFGILSVTEYQTRRRFDSEWRDGLIPKLAQGIYESKDWGALPILADALMESGADQFLIDHLGQPNHWKGCYVLDYLRGVEI